MESSVMSSLRTKIAFLVEGSIIQDMDEVFEEHKMAKSESPAMDENIIDDHSTVQPGRQEDQASPIQVRSTGFYFLLVIFYSR